MRSTVSCINRFQYHEIYAILYQINHYKTITVRCKRLRICDKNVASQCSDPVRITSNEEATYDLPVMFQVAFHVT